MVAFKQTRFMIVCWWLMVVALISGCDLQRPALDPSTATVILNTAAVSVEAAETAAEDLYKIDQERALAVAVQAGSDKEGAKAAVGAVRTRWAPVWETFRKARETYSRLTAGVNTAQEAARMMGELGDLEKMVQGYLIEAKLRLKGVR